MSEHIVEFAGTITEYNGIPMLQDGALREEIVRCSDCKHYHGAGIASLSPFCSWMNDSDAEPDGFCAWGERRDAE